MELLGMVGTTILALRCRSCGAINLREIDGIAELPSVGDDAGADVSPPRSESAVQVSFEHAFGGRGDGR